MKRQCCLGPVRHCIGHSHCFWTGRPGLGVLVRWDICWAVLAVAGLAGRSSQMVGTFAGVVSWRIGEWRLGYKGRVYLFSRGGSAPCMKDS
jgi:hypothetical protein